MKLNKIFLFLKIYWYGINFNLKFDMFFLIFSVIMLVKYDININI